MLSRTSRQEILRKLSVKVGYPLKEEDLSPDTRKAITSLADFQRHLYVVSEILNGERGRVQQSVFLSVSSKVRKDREMEAHADEIEKIQKELDDKMAEISAQILREAEAKESGNPPPTRERQEGAVELKCPTCGAALPIPTGRYIKCQYCDSTISIQDVGSQMREIIRSI